MPGYKYMQRKVEESTYECIDSISEELGVNVPYYPESHWVGKKLRFEDLFMGHKYLSCFNEVKTKRRSTYIKKPSMILIAEYDPGVIAEEAGHFIHLTSSGMKAGDKNNIDRFGLDIIKEMFGFFCSKLIEPERENILRDYTDPMPLQERGEGKLIDLDTLEKDEFSYEFHKYYQGYMLGEELFNSYISGLSSKENIKELLSHPLDKETEGIATFIMLKYDLMKKGRIMEY